MHCKFAVYVPVVVCRPLLWAASYLLTYFNVLYYVINTVTSPLQRERRLDRDCV